MKTKNLGVVVFLVAIAVTMGSASATTYTVNSSMTNTAIQGVITNANSGDIIQFKAGTYTGISLNINKALTLQNYLGTVTIKGDTSKSAVFNVLNTAGVTIKGFTINGSSVRDYILLNNVNSSTITNNVFNNNVNGTSAVYITTGYGLNIANNTMNMFGYGKNTGIAGYSIYNTIIKNNTLLSGGDAMNIYQAYGNLTITNNTINHMALKHGDGISIINCGTPETSTSTSITNNKIDDTLYGIFIGGYFKGTVSGNTVTNTPVGMNITGKDAATSGNLNASILNNNVTGMAMENPDVVYLNLTGNTINQLNTTGYSVLTNSYYSAPGDVYVTNNIFNSPVTTAFRNSADVWTGNNI